MLTSLIHCINAVLITFDFTLIFSCIGRGHKIGRFRYLVGNVWSYQFVTKGKFKDRIGPHLFRYTMSNLLKYSKPSHATHNTKNM